MGSTRSRCRGRRRRSNTKLGATLDSSQKVSVNYAQCSNKLAHFTIAAYSLATTGCIATTAVQHHAAHYQEWNTQRKQFVEHPAQPGYYFLLPLTIPFDIITA